MITKFRKITFAYLLLALLIVLAFSLVYKAHLHKRTIIPSNNTEKYAQSQGISSSANISSNTANTPTPKSPSPDPDSNAKLIAPFGTFVSNHRPNLSGTEEQLSEQSVCNTNAGATCYISFTNGSTTKTLATETTDASGTAYWSWNIKDSGLTPGTWTVEAIATLNGQESKVNDSIDLVIAQ